MNTEANDIDASDTSTMCKDNMTNNSKTVDGDGSPVNMVTQRRTDRVTGMISYCN